MNPFVVIDTDFLSSFLKIDRLHLIPQFYQVEMVAIPPAVHREIALTRFAANLAAVPWVQIVPPAISEIEHLRTYVEYNLLGAGEQESIALALQSQAAILLCSDNRARRFAQGVGIQVNNIAAFLLACRVAKLLNRIELRQIVEDLAELVYYRFRQDELARLLE